MSIRRHATALAIALLAAPPARAGDGEPGAAAVERLPEIEVTATRREEPAFGTPRATAVVDERAIAERQPRTAPEALREAPGVVVQQTAFGQGSPFIRGLTGNQVLILVDGVRLNNSTFRFGANQYMATIDPFTIARIEVVRGPGSVLYGSDALGGVVHVLTREREDFTHEVDAGGRLLGRVSTAAGERTAHVDVEGNALGLSFVGGGTLSDFDDVEGGGPTGTQPNTGYRSEAADAKLGFRFDRQEVIAAWQLVRQPSVPRSDRLNLALPGKKPADLRLDFEPQERQLGYFSYRLDDPASALAEVRSNVSYQVQTEGRFEVKTATPGVEQRERDEVRTVGTAHSAALGERARQRFTTGIEVYHDDVGSRRTDVTLASGAAAPKRPRFADGGRYDTLGVFVQDDVAVVPDQVKLLFGGRYSHVEVDGEFADPKTGPVVLDQKHDALTGSAHAWISPVREVALTAGIAQGFRAPNFDDLSVFGQVGQGFEVPNPDAEPERSVAYEVGTKVEVGDDPWLAGALFGHWTEYQDLLQRAPGTLDGLPFIDADQDGVQDPGEENVVQRRNLGKARIFGVEADLRARLPRGASLLGERWSFFGTFLWTYGENRTDDEPLRGIPPAQGILGVRADARGGRCFFEGVGQLVRDQERIAAADTTDPRIPPGGTPGYEVYHLRAGARLALFRGPAPLRHGGGEKGYDGEIAVALENLLDRDYRVHGSGINGPGRSLIVTLTLRF